MFKIGDKLDKANYTQGAIWCNANNAKIEIVDGEYVIVAIPEPTVEELQAEARTVRNSYLEKYVDPKQLILVWNSLTAEEQELYKDYRQYLLDYPQTEGWYEQNPLTFEEWKQSVEESENEEVIEDGLQR